MGVFDKDIKETSPITARLLRDILAARRTGYDEEDIIRYNKLLHRILERVRYNTEEDIWEHRTSMAAMGIDLPFDSTLTEEVNQKISAGEDPSDIAKWINTRGISPSNSLKKFASYFKERGFTVTFRTYDYLVSEHRDTDKLISISWKEEK